MKRHRAGNMGGGGETEEHVGTSEVEPEFQPEVSDDRVVLMLTSVLSL